MKTLVTLVGAALMVLPVSAAAESLSGALTFGYGWGDVLGTSAKLTSKSFDGRIASTIGSNMSFGLRANAANLRLSGFAGHVTGQLFGGVTRAKLDGGGLSSTDYGFGVSYNMGGHTGLDSTLSLELAHSRGDALGYSGSNDTIRIGWAVPMGRSTGKVPLNRLADAMLVSAHDALTTSILSTY